MNLCSSRAISKGCNSERTSCDPWSRQVNEKQVGRDEAEGVREGNFALEKVKGTQESEVVVKELS